MLGRFRQFAPQLRIVGGMASAGPRPRSNALILNDWVESSGGVALALRGPLRVDVVVSQGCRPVGPTLEVTRADGKGRVAAMEIPYSGVVYVGATEQESLC